jgi:hypothetical protein
MHQKVIGIGFHKTGTTSLGKALVILGYSNFHGASIVRKRLGNKIMMDLLYERKLDPILKIAEEADSMEDNPWFSIYKALDSYFPHSKFILTIRDEKKWLSSAKRYFKGESDFRKHIYGVGNPKGNEDIFLNKYRQHNLEVINYFEDRPEDLLIVELDKGYGWNELCQFLNKPIPFEQFPHLNKSQNRLFKKVNHYIKKLID